MVALFSLQFKSLCISITSMHDLRTSLPHGRRIRCRRTHGILSAVNVGVTTETASLSARRQSNEESLTSLLSFQPGYRQDQTSKVFADYLIEPTQNYISGIPYSFWFPAY
jgi:hypothetical protein